jgi:3-oxoadipate enol-lactonase
LPVVFHHGIGTNHEIWSDWLPALAARHQVVRFDMRGFGASPLPPVSHRWSIEELIEDLFDVAAAVTSGPVHLVGESLGGTVVLAAALARPDKVASVAISNATYQGQGVGRIAGWRAEFAAMGVAGWSQQMMNHRFVAGQGKPDALAWFAAEQAKAAAHVVVGLGEMLAAADLSDIVGRLTKPLLIMGPDSSPFIAPGYFARLKDMVPNSELMIVPNTRHGLPFTHGRQLSQVLAEFIERRVG